MAARGCPNAGRHVRRDECVKHSLYGNQHISVASDHKITSVLVPVAALEDLVTITIGIGASAAILLGSSLRDRLEHDEE